MAPIQVGIVGYGTAAKVFHLPFINPNPDLKVIAFLQRAEAPKSDSDTEPGKHCKVDYPQTKHYRSAKDFFADDAIELVIVCTTPDSHYHMTEQALQAGKHVVVEKPFTVTTAEADKLIAIAKKTSKFLTVFQNRRYDSDFRTLQHLMNLNPNPFGKITEFINHYDIDWPEWATRSKAEESPGDGMMYALGTHSIDQTLELFGLPTSVTAFVRLFQTEQGDAVAEDSFTIILQYGGEQKNLIATVKTTIVSPQTKQMKFWVRGTGGSFMKEGEDVQIEQLFEDNMKIDDPDFGVEPTRFHGKLYTKKPFDAHFDKEDETAVIFSGTVPSKKGSYMDYYRDVVAAIRGEGPLVVKPEQSRNGIRIIELARESAQKGVTVPWS